MDSTGKHAPGYMQEYQGHQCISVAISFIVLAITAVMARFYAKTRLKASWAMDDYLMVPSLVTPISIIADIC